VLPLIAALVSGLAAAANNVFAKQLPYNTTQTTLVLWSTSVVANIPMVFIIGESPPLLELSPAWGYLVLFSVASILASWFLLKGMKYIDAGIAGILGLTEIAFALAFGIVLFGETIDSVSFVGALVIVFASSLPFVYKRYGAKKGQKVLSTEG
jgi:drug/metabolite transporter (DMT)-like permease